MGLVELHNFFSCRGALVVNDQVIIPGEENLEINEKSKRKHCNYVYNNLRNNYIY